MKKFLTSILLVALTAISSNAQLLWKISGNGLEKPSYLFGTHHVAPISVLDSVPGFNEALSSAEKVYGELIMSEAQSPAAQQLMMSAAMAPQDSTLTAVLTAAQTDSLNTMLQKYMGPMVSAAQFAPMKPAIVSTVVAMVQAQSAFPDFNQQEQLDSGIQAKRSEVLRQWKSSVRHYSAALSLNKPMTSWTSFATMANQLRWHTDSPTLILPATFQRCFQ